MFNLFSRQWKIACVIFGSLLIVSAEKACSQVRITAETGNVDKNWAVGAEVGYDFFEKASVQTGFLSSGFQGGVYHGITAGPIVLHSIIPFVGVYRLSYGHNSSVDRYVHSGVTEVLATNSKIDTWTYPVGIKYFNGPFFANAGYIIGNKKFFYLTVGVTHLFR